MSIDAAVAKLVRDGELVFVPPVYPGAVVVRDVFVSREVWDELVGDDASPEERIAKTAGRARAKLAFYATGGTFAFALDPYDKKASALIARNAPVAEGVLDLRVTDPRPQLRLFGCAAKHNVLILLSYAERDGLDFRTEVTRCRARWDRLFPNHPPLVGTQHADYFSNTLPG